MDERGTVRKHRAPQRLDFHYPELDTAHLDVTAADIDDSPADVSHASRSSGGR
jgi:hypothetical protein